MVVLRGGGRFLVSEVRLYSRRWARTAPGMAIPTGVQGYLTHKKPPPSLGPPSGLRRVPTVWSQGGAVSYARGTSAQHRGTS